MNAAHLSSNRQLPWHLYNQSCEKMYQLASGSVDLLVTSPPYWIPPSDALMGPALLRGGDGEIAGSYERLLTLLTRCFEEAFRVLKPGGLAAVNVASTREKGVLKPLPCDLTLRLLALGFTLQEEIVWRRWRAYDRRAGTLIQKPYPGYYFPGKTHEWLLIFKKPGPPIYRGRSEEGRESSRIETGRLYVHEISASIWNVLPITPARKALSGKVSHPCPFPGELAARLIELYSYRGDLVLDPFSGSGTTGQAAHHLGRLFAGYEINPDFVALARRRRLKPLERQRHITRFESIP